MRRDLILGIIVSALLHGFVLYGDKLIKFAPKPKPPKEEEAKVQLIEMPKLDVEEPEKIENNDEQKPLGILSDSTIRKKIGLGKFNPEEKVGNIMTKPASCIKPNTSLADIQIQLIRRRVRSVCVTEDGTDQTPLIGIISEHDLIIAHGFNPAVILREIQNAESVETLKVMMDRSSELLNTYRT